MAKIWIFEPDGVLAQKLCDSLKKEKFDAILCDEYKPVPQMEGENAPLVILDAQLNDGGWALTGTVSDADITGMALQALAPYYKTDVKVKAAIENMTGLTCSDVNIRIAGVNTKKDK